MNVDWKYAIVSKNFLRYDKNMSRKLRIVYSKIPVLATPISMYGAELLNELFEFEITIVTNKPLSKLHSLLTTPLTITLSETRFINGIITRIEEIDPIDHRHHQYRITLSPSLILLDRETHYQTWHRKSVIDIAREILRRYDIHDTNFKWITKNYPPIDFEAQYDETDYAFLCRLFSETGIQFAFEHTHTKHQLVLFDTNRFYRDLESDIRFDSETICVEALDDLTHSKQRTRRTTRANSRHQNIKPGMCYSSKQIIMRVSHYCTDYSRLNLSSQSTSCYHNTIETRVIDELIEPRLKPKIPSVQLAQVIGPKKSEQYVDKHDRVQIQFHWPDARPRSGWVSMSQTTHTLSINSSWAPYIGQPVIVSFHEGDANRPFLLGGIYDRHHSPPFDTKQQTGGLFSHNGNRLQWHRDQNSQPEKMSLECQATKDYVLETEGKSTHTIKYECIIEIESGDYTIESRKGDVCIDAKDIRLQVGTSKLQLNEEGIFFDADKILLGKHATQSTARVDDDHRCPQVNFNGLPHKGGKILNGSDNVFFNNRPAARSQDTAFCVGAIDVLSQGSASVFINDRPAIRKGDMTQHGGKIVTGSEDVFID